MENAGINSEELIEKALQKLKEKRKGAKVFCISTRKRPCNYYGVSNLLFCFCTDCVLDAITLLCFLRVVPFLHSSD